MPSSSRRYQTGFSVVELATVIAVLAILATSFFVAFITLYSSSARSSKDLALDMDNQQAMSIIERDIRYSFAFEKDINSNTNVRDDFGYDTIAGSLSSITYSGTSSTLRALILAGYATTTNPSSKTRQTIYLTTPFSCATAMYDNAQLPYYTAYFARNGKLYRRINPDTTSATCNGAPQQKQSCPPDAPGAWNARCKANDEVIANNVTAFTLTYYDNSSPGTPIDVYNAPDPTEALNAADSVEVTLTLSNGTTITSTNTIRVAKVNYVDG